MERRRYFFGQKKEISRMKKIGTLLLLVGFTSLLLVAGMVDAAPTRLADGRSSRYFIITKEDLSSYPYTTTIKNTEFPGSPVHKARIRIEYLDAGRQDLGSESFEIDCQPNDMEWFRWHPPAGTKYYRYIFY
jgi:hypothetical protein